MNSNSSSPTKVGRSNRAWFFELRYSTRISLSGARFARVLKRWAFTHLLGYLLLAVLVSWPLASQLGTSLALGTETAATVPLFTTWTIWWNADRASHAFVGYWDAPIFFPESDALAFSEPIVTSVSVAPIVWFTGNRLLAHNAFLLFSIALNGWTGFHVLRFLRIGHLAAAVGGVLMVMLPMVQNELGVLQLVPLFGILGTFCCLLRFGRRPNVVRAVCLGGMFALTYLTCANYGLFASVLLLPAAPWLIGRRLGELRTWRALFMAAGVAALLISPVICAQLRVARSHELVRSLDLAQRLSARPTDYLVVPREHRLEPSLIRQYRGQSQQRLCPGLIMYGLALIGVACGLTNRRLRRWTLFTVTILVLSLLLSLGPSLQLAGWSPYESLWNWYPGFAQVRSPFRMAVFAQLATVFLAAIAIDASARRLLKLSNQVGKSQATLLRVAGLGIGLLVVVATLWEILPVRQMLYTPPNLAQHSGWIDWLKKHSDTQAVAAHLPFPQGSHVREYEQTAVWMVLASYHQRAIVNGYSGFLPERYLQLKQGLATFPDASSIAQLRSRGVEYCIVERSFANRSRLESHPVAEAALAWQYGDDLAEVDIYQLTPDPQR